MIQQRQMSTAPPQPISTLAQARKLSDGLLDDMTELLGLLENETALVRAGNIRAALALEARKSETSQRYMAAIGLLKSSRDYFTQSAPELLRALQRHHDVFRTMLQVNLTVLATAHAVSEGIIRGVNGELRKKSIPQTYTAAGHRAMPNPHHASPLSVSRTL